MTYTCKCGGALVYVEQDLENGEHHYCSICGEIYPYGEENIDELKKKNAKAIVMLAKLQERLDCDLVSQDEICGGIADVIRVLA